MPAKGPSSIQLLKGQQTLRFVHMFPLVSYLPNNLFVVARLQTLRIKGKDDGSDQLNCTETEGHDHNS